jgi:hypothetical protein
LDIIHRAPLHYDLGIKSTSISDKTGQSAVNITIHPQITCLNNIVKAITLMLESASDECRMYIHNRYWAARFVRWDRRVEFKCDKWIFERIRHHIENLC